MIGVRTETHKLIHYPGMEESYQWELFDLTRDSDETNNLHHDPESAALQKRMVAKLRKLIRDLDDPVEAPGLK